VKYARDTYVDERSQLWTDIEQKPGVEDGDFLASITGSSTIAADLVNDLKVQGLKAARKGDIEAPSILRHSRAIEAYQATHLCHAWHQRDYNYPKDFVVSEMNTAGIPVDRTDANPYTWDNLSKSYANWYKEHPIDDVGRALASGLLILGAREKLQRNEE
jgi:hypothetical protein